MWLPGEHPKISPMLEPGRPGGDQGQTKLSKKNRLDFKCKEVRKDFGGMKKKIVISQEDGGLGKSKDSWGRI